MFNIELYIKIIILIQKYSFKETVQVATVFSHPKYQTNYLFHILMDVGIIGNDITGVFSLNR